MHGRGREAVGQSITLCFFHLSHSLLSLSFPSHLSSIHRYLFKSSLVDLCSSITIPSIPSRIILHPQSISTLWLNPPPLFVFDSRLGTFARQTRRCLIVWVCCSIYIVVLDFFFFSLYFILSFFNSVLVNQLLFPSNCICARVNSLHS